MLNKDRSLGGWPIRQWTLLAAVLSGLAIGLTGCPQARVPPPEATPEATTDLPSDAAAIAPGKVELQVVDLTGYENQVARQLGKVVLVDFWATWCKPCRQQFQHTVQLGRKYQDQGLVVMSVSIDQLDKNESLDELKARVLDFLKQQSATFPNLLIPVTNLAPGDPGIEDILIERFELDGGAVPHYKLYDRQGRLARKFAPNLETGEAFSDAEVEAAIQKLLAQ